MSHLLSFPGCCWMSSSLNFLANSMNPFIGLLGLFSSFAAVSFFLAGDMGGDMTIFFEVSGLELIIGVAEDGVSSGECCSSNSKRLNRSQRSGVRVQTASGWLGGRQTSPTDRSWHGMPYLSTVSRGWAEHQPAEGKEKVLIADAPSIENGFRFHHARPRDL